MGKRLANWLLLGLILLIFIIKITDQGFIRRNGRAPLNKTFFCEQWSAREVAENIIEGLQNLTEVKFENGRFILSGRTTRGLRLELIAEENGVLVTSYPIVKINN